MFLKLALQLRIRELHKTLPFPEAPYPKLPLVYNDNKYAIK
jgi:hypothetical protein